jgi:NitT/TauT family transport system ATP-binding protein
MRIKDSLFELLEVAKFESIYTKMLELRNISLNYEKIQAVNDISLAITPGEICAVLGPSGAGKTSILNILAGNVTHYTGEVSLNNRAIDYKKDRIGLISQDFGLLPWRTAYKNIILPLKIKGLDVKNYEGKIDHVMKKLGIFDLKKRFPLSLSGGQKQRLAIAAAFVPETDLLLMDEPFSALDQVSRESTQELFFDIWNETRPMTVFVTHSIEEAVFVGRKIMILSKAPGSIIKTLDNPTFGQDNVRVKSEYIDICKEIREMIKAEWSER